MTYTFCIGEALLIWNKDSVDISAVAKSRNDVNIQGGFPSKKSYRTIDTSAWHRAIAALGLNDVVFDARRGGSEEFQCDYEWYRPLITGEDAMPITAAHAEVVGDRYQKYLATGGNDATAINCGEWLSYWLGWAVQNCKNPVFATRRDKVTTDGLS